MASVKKLFTAAVGVALLGSLVLGAPAAADPFEVTDEYVAIEVDVPPTFETVLALTENTVDALEQGPVPLCFGVPALIVGTPGDDVIDGTPLPDVIHGLGGNDAIRGLGGDDLVCGGSGADNVNGNAGFDRVRGGSGNDVVRGGPGDDDRLEGRAGNDVVKGGPGSDVVVGGSGSDSVFDGPGSDAIDTMDGRMDDVFLCRDLIRDAWDKDGRDVRHGPLSIHC